MYAGRRRAWGPISFLLVLSASGCSVVPGLSTVRGLLQMGRTEGGFTEQDLRAETAAYVLRFQSVITASADEILASSGDPEIERHALLWKIRLVPLADEALFSPDPQAGYLALYALAVAQQDYLENGAGRALFGPQQGVAVTAANEMVAAGREIGGRFLDPAQQARLQDQVEALAEKNPIGGVFVQDTVQAVVGSIGEGGTFDWILHYPMAPFRAVEGVESGAAAIREFNVTAERFSRIVAAMPQRVRWNAELLSFEIERREAVASTVASLDSLAASADRFSRTTQALPGEIRLQLEQLFARIEGGQGALQQTLADARSAGQDLQPLAASLERTAGQLEQAGLAWGALVAEARAPEPREPGVPAPRPFDIADYERTALQLTDAAKEVRGLVAEVRSLTVAGEPMPGLERLEDAGRSLVDLAAVRVLQLLAAFFVLLFVYRRIETHLAARRAGRSGSVPGG